jgi:acyl-CoA thioester hydrolase
MKKPFVMQRRVELVDTDMAGIVHFSAFFRYVETAEHEFFRSLGLSIISQLKERQLGWPRVSCDFEFIKPLRFGDVFEVHLSVKRIGKSSITYEACIVKEGTILARGHSTSVCCVIGAESRLCPVDIPSDVDGKLRPYLTVELG